MAGYHNFSKSNNAIEAEAGGRFPATHIARQLGVPSGFILAHAPSHEWHHSSKYFNVVNYYDLDTVSEWLAEPETQDLLARWKEAQKPGNAEVLKGARIEWLEWGGTRNHPVAYERSADNCDVIHFPNKKFLTIKLPSGQTFKKGRDTRGFRVIFNGKRDWRFGS